MTLRIRKFRRADAARVLSLNQALSAVHGVKIKGNSRQLAEACLDDRLAICLVAEIDKNIVGFIISYDRMNFECGTRVCTISQLYTDEKFRRLGIGLALMRRMAEDAIKRGCFRMDVTAAKDNKVSNAFYKKTGFFLRINKSNRYVLHDKSLRRFASRSN